MTQLLHLRFVQFINVDHAAAAQRIDGGFRQPARFVRSEAASRGRDDHDAGRFGCCTTAVNAYGLALVGAEEVEIVDEEDSPPVVARIIREQLLGSAVESELCAQCGPSPWWVLPGLSTMMRDSAAIFSQVLQDSPTCRRRHRRGSHVPAAIERDADGLKTCRPAQSHATDAVADVGEGRPRILCQRAPSLGVTAFARKSERGLLEFLRERIRRAVAARDGDLHRKVGQVGPEDSLPLPLRQVESAHSAFLR